MEQQDQHHHQQPVQQNMIIYNFNPNDGILTPSANPVQVEFGSTDIARQINQQVQLQYANNIQSGFTQDQNHQIVITNQPTYDTTENIDPSFIKTPKTKMRPPGERVSCAECDKTFSCNANLRDHMRLHTGERPFKCAECDMSFAQRSNWRLHKRVHTGERPYMCGICGKTFSRSSHLPGHIRVHTGERPYQCELCDHTFASAQALKNHTRTHTGEKPFVCSVCTTAFTHSSSLSSHKKRCTGVKQKRGRPAGTTWRKKKNTNRSRSRSKKRGRLTRSRSKKGEDSTDPEIKQEVDMDHENDTSSMVYDAAKNVLLQEDALNEDVVQISVDVLNAAVDKEQVNDLVKSEAFSNAMHEDEDEEPQRVQLTEDMVQAAATAAGLDDTSDLHQEAALTMTTLQHGVVNLAVQEQTEQPIQ